MDRGASSGDSRWRWSAARCPSTVTAPDRDSGIGFMGLVLFGVGIQMAARQLSFARVLGLVVAGQVIMHALTKVTVDRPVPGEFWTYHPHVPPQDWLSSPRSAASVLATHLLFDLVLAAVLYGCESSVWAWFRLAALRVLSPPPSFVIPLTPDTPVLVPVHDAPTFPPLLWASASGRRGPPRAPAAG